MASCASQPWLLSDRQKAYADRELTPAELADEAPRELRPRTKLRVRVLADEAYQELVWWRRDVEDQLAHANTVLARYDLELDVVGIRSWSRPRDDSDLHAALEHLVATQPAHDVDLVVGITTPLALVSSSMHHMGLAQLMGRHLVVRAMDDVVEMKAFEEHLDALSDEDRLRLYHRRKQHKQAMVLVHEIAHCLGAIHVESADGVMSPVWSPAMAGFAPEELDILRLGVRALADAEFAALGWADARRAVLERSRWPDWSVSERARELRASTRPPPAAAPPESRERVVTPTAPAAPRPGEATRAQITRLPVPTRLPPPPAAVSVAPSHAPPAPPAPSAVSIAPAAPAPPTPSAVAAAPTPSPPPLPSLTVAPPPLAGSAEAAGMARARRELDSGHVSRGERLLSTLPDGRERTALTQRAARMRRELALPAGAIPEASEPEYAGAMTRGVRAAFDGDAAGLRAALDVLEARYASTAGPDVVRCAAAYQAKDEPRTRTACDAATARVPDALYPRYVRALLSAGRSLGRGEQALRAIITRDPGFEPAWLTLAEVLRAGRSTAALEALAAQYRAEHGGEPPWR